MEYHSSENISLVDDYYDDDQDFPTSVSITASASPIFYQLDDAPSPKKRFLFLFALICILCYYKVFRVYNGIYQLFSSKRVEGKRVVTVPMVDGDVYPPADSWTWRKYGQKPIKGSPYPRYLVFLYSTFFMFKLV